MLRQNQLKAAFCRSFALVSLGWIPFCLAVESSSIEEVGVPGSTPASVVEAQMLALSDWHTDPRAASRVFELASRANQAVTGPLAAFRAMVEADPFESLLTNQGWSAGKAVEADGVAAVLVTLIDNDGNLHAFRFYLSQQTGSPGKPWRTDAVLPLTLPKPMPAPRDAI